MATTEQIREWIRTAPDGATANQRVDTALTSLRLPWQADQADRQRYLSTYLVGNPGMETGWQVPGATAPTPAAPAQPPAQNPTPTQASQSQYEPEEFLDGGLFGLPGKTVRAIRIETGPKYRVLDEQGFRVGTWDASTNETQSLLAPAPAPQQAAGQTGGMPANPNAGNHGNEHGAHGESAWSKIWAKGNIRGGGGGHH